MAERKPFHVFPDRSLELFARDDDVQGLLSRCRSKGVTFLTGRPRMGKSWLLEETCRRLETDRDALIGYFECPGGAVDKADQRRKLIDELGRLREKWESVEATV